MPLIDSTMKRKLQERHVGYLHANNFRLPDNCVFEPPCSIKWMQIDHSLSIGAFSYAVSGYYFGARIGRYTSIGEVVQVGRHNHPTNWSTTSPLFYRDYQAVLDFPVPEADGVHPNDFMLGAPNQKVHTTTIGNDVWIGHGAFISPGVVIGDGAVIGAYSVVTKDVPPYAVVAGAPAVVRKMRFSEDTIERMLKLRWWRFAFWDLKGASTTDPARFIESIEEKIAADLLKPYEPEKFSISELADAGD